MNLWEFDQSDGLGFGNLVRDGEVTPSELVGGAFAAIDAVNGQLNAVIGCVDLPMNGADIDASAPFLGVPFVLKDL